MNKKIVLMSALAAVSFGMTSCIDNEEPASVETLRDAMANELNANAALTNAKAATETAKAAQEQAKVAVEAAKAAQEEIATKMKEVDLAKAELSLELAKANNETSIAQAKTALAKAEAELAVAKVNGEQNLAVAQAALVAQQTTLEKAKIQSEVDLANAQITAVKNLDLNLTSAVNAMTVAQKNYFDKANSLQEAQEGLVVALGQAQRDSLYSTYNYTKLDYELDVTAAERAVTAAEFNVTAKENALALFKETAEKNEEAAWVKLYNDKQTEIDELNKKLNAVEVELVEANNAVTAASKALNDKDTELARALNEYNNAAKLYTYPVENEDLVEALGDYYDWNDYYGNRAFVFKSSAIQSVNPIANEDFSFTADHYYSSSLVNYLKGKVMSASEMAEATQNVKELNAQLAKLKADYEADLAAYNSAVAAYQKAAVDFLWSEETGSSTLYNEISTLAQTYYYEYLPEADAANVAAKLASYLPLRKAFDGFENDDLKAIVTGYTAAKYTELRDYLYSYGTSTTVGNSPKYYGGAYADYVTASNKLQDRTDYVVYSEEDLDEMYNNGYGLQYYYGTLGKYAYAVRYIAEKTNAIDNQKDWKALLDAVQADIDAIDAQTAKLNAELENNRAKELNPYIADVEAAQNAKTDINLKKSDLMAQKSAAEAIQNEAWNLSKLSSANLKTEDYALYVAKSINAKENDIALAKETVASKKSALEEAKATLEAYVAGTLTNETVISNAKLAVEKAEADFKAAEAAYELAKAEYEAVVAILAGDEDAE